MKGPGVVPSLPPRVRRLAEEISEVLPEGGGPRAFHDLSKPGAAVLLGELDYARYPKVHERRVPSFGAMVGPVAERAAIEEATQLHITSRPLGPLDRADARRFADGLSSWLVLTDPDGEGSGRDDRAPDELWVFDRAAGSERDLVVLAHASGAAVVQRHPAGFVRVVGTYGVVRWDGVAWDHAPNVTAWIDRASGGDGSDSWNLVSRLLEFAVHDLGARGIGAILVHQPNGYGVGRPDPEPVEPVVPVLGGRFEVRLPAPPPLQVLRPADLAPLRHVLAQIDGAAVFDGTGTLRELGVRLLPSSESLAAVEGDRGMRHTAGRRFSFDEPSATVIVVSEDGPVTVWRGGALLGRSGPGGAGGALPFVAADEPV